MLNVQDVVFVQENIFALTFDIFLLSRSPFKSISLTLKLSSCKYYRIVVLAHVFCSLDSFSFRPEKYSHEKEIVKCGRILSSTCENNLSPCPVL